MSKSAKFFTAEERQRIEAAVRAAELRTRGEIVPLVVDAAHSYPRAEIQGGRCWPSRWRKPTGRLTSPARSSP